MCPIAGMRMDYIIVIYIRGWVAGSWSLLCYTEVAMLVIAEAGRVWQQHARGWQIRLTTCVLVRSICHLPFNCCFPPVGVLRKKKSSSVLLIRWFVFCDASFFDLHLPMMVVGCSCFNVLTLNLQLDISWLLCLPLASGTRPMSEEERPYR